MQFLAHTGGFDLGESQDFNHFARENGLKVLFISFVFIAITYVLTTILSKHTGGLHLTAKHKKPIKETTNE